MNNGEVKENQTKAQNNYDKNYYKNMGEEEFQVFHDRFIIFHTAGIYIPPPPPSSKPRACKNKQKIKKKVRKYNSENKTRSTTFGQGKVGVSCQSYGIPKCSCCNSDINLIEPLSRRNTPLTELNENLIVNNQVGKNTHKSYLHCTSDEIVDLVDEPKSTTRVQKRKNLKIIDTIDISDNDSMQETNESIQVIDDSVQEINDSIEETNDNVQESATNQEQSNMTYLNNFTKDNKYTEINPEKGTNIIIDHEKQESISKIQAINNALQEINNITQESFSNNDESETELEEKFLEMIKNLNKKMSENC